MQKDWFGRPDHDADMVGKDVDGRRRRLRCGKIAEEGVFAIRILLELLAPGRGGDDLAPDLFLDPLLLYLTKFLAHCRVEAIRRGPDDEE